MAGENMLIEDDEDQKKGKPQEVEFVPVTTKEGDEDDDDHPEDSRLSEDNEDREELRRKRREEKTDRAARRKQAIERDKTELNFLRQRNESLEKRMFQVEKSVVGNAMTVLPTRLQKLRPQKESLLKPSMPVTAKMLLKPCESATKPCRRHSSYRSTSTSITKSPKICISNLSSQPNSKLKVQIRTLLALLRTGYLRIAGTIQTPRTRPRRLF
jgi:hypothetical protein